MMNKKVLFSSMIALATLGFSVMSSAGGIKTPPASVDDGSGVLFGVQLGYVDNHWDEIHHDVFTNFAIDVHNHANVGGRTYIGYAFNRYFASELGWTYLGKSDIHRFELVVPEHRKLTTIDNYAYDFTTQFNAPIDDTLGVFGRVGINYLVSAHSLNWRTIPFIPITQDPDRRHTTNLNVTFGAGAYYNVLPCLRLELAWTRFEGNGKMDDDFQPNPDFFSFGVSYRLHNA